MRFAKGNWDEPSVSEYYIGYLEPASCNFRFVFIVPLLVTPAALAYGLVPLVDKLTSRWFLRDLDLRANLVANTVHDPLRARIDSGSKARTVQFPTRLTRDERLYAAGYCANATSKPVATPLFPAEIRCDSLTCFETGETRRLATKTGTLHVAAMPLRTDSGPQTTSLVLVHDMSFIARRSEEMRKYLFS